MQHVFYFYEESLKHDSPWMFDSDGAVRDGFAIYQDCPYTFGQDVSAGDSVLIRRDYKGSIDLLKSALTPRFKKARLLREWVIITQGDFGDAGCVGLCSGVKLGEERGVAVSFGYNLELWTGKAVRASKHIKAIK